MTTAAAQAFQRAVLSKPTALERSPEDTQPLQVQRKTEKIACIIPSLTAGQSGVPQRTGRTEFRLYS